MLVGLRPRQSLGRSSYTSTVARRCSRGGHRRGDERRLLHRRECRRSSVFANSTKHGALETELLWKEAGFDMLTSIVDLGCVQGFTSVDLARTVGESGHICAVDKSAGYREHLGEHLGAESITNVNVLNADATAGLDSRPLRWGVLPLVSCLSHR